MDKALKPPTKDELIVAAIRLVDLIVEYRHPTAKRPSTVPRREPEVKGTAFRIITGAQLVQTSAEVWRMRDIADNPVIWSLKRGLKEVGQMLYDLVGSTDALVAVAEQIADRDPDNYARRISPIDSAWDGVGKGDDRWRS